MTKILRICNVKKTKFDFWIEHIIQHVVDQLYYERTERITLTIITFNWHNFQKADVLGQLVLFTIDEQYKSLIVITLEESQTDNINQMIIRPSSSQTFIATFSKIWDFVNFFTHTVWYHYYLSHKATFTVIK